jgi:hypothetical protein
MLSEPQTRARSAPWHLVRPISLMGTKLWLAEEAQEYEQIEGWPRDQQFPRSTSDQIGFVSNNAAANNAAVRFDASRSD